MGANREYKAHLHTEGVLSTRLGKPTLGFANLQGAYLRETKLQFADLRKANLQGATLWGADLQGATLTEAHNLTQDQVNKACGDEDTKLPTIPEGLTPPLLPPLLCPK